MSNVSEKFSFPLPIKDGEVFEHFMQRADEFLVEQGYRPAVRAGMLPKLLRDLLGVRRSSDIESRYDESLVGLKREDLTDAYAAWYVQIYGAQIRPSRCFVSVPVRLGHSVWRMRLPRYFADCAYFVDRDLSNKGIPCDEQGIGGRYNVLALVEDLTPGLVARLRDEQLYALQELAVDVASSLSNWEDYPETKLFDIAKSDYACSTDNLLNARLEQSMWASQQALEKTIKGFLDLARIEYPKNKDGHDLELLGELLRTVVSLPEPLLKKANLHPKVRYGLVPCTQQSALDANWAVLISLEIFAKSYEAQSLIARWWAEEA